MPTNDNGLESRTNGWMIAGLVLMLVGVLAFPVYRVIEPTQRAEAAEETQGKLALAGEALWTSTCASCHGSYGQGVDAPALNSKQFLTIASDEQILAIASAGIPGTEMAAYGQRFGGPFTQEQLVSVVACIRSWEPTAPDRPDWRDMLEPGGGAGHDEAPAEGDGHDEAPPADDHDADGADDHDEVAEDGPAACGPNYDPAAFEDHDEDGAADHDEAPAEGGGHDEDGDSDADGHDEGAADHDA